MLKTRILIIVISAAIISLIFLLPKVVVHNDDESIAATDSTKASKKSQVHNTASDDVLTAIRSLRSQFDAGSPNEKNAIFADSLAELYLEAGKFDSSAWFAEEASKFFNTRESWKKAGDSYYQAYSFAVDPGKQGQMALKAQEFYRRVLTANPKDLEVKTNLAMTYLSSPSPMQGITLLREVLAEDPKNELALLNMGMLSIQSGQYDRAIERLTDLIEVNPNHLQGQLLLGIAWMNKGDKQKAREQFEKVKKMEKDPAVQAEVDSYLKDLK
jgi:tetratricopeptide (TPR) repeat protein